MAKTITISFDTRGGTSLPNQVYTVESSASFNLPSTADVTKAGCTLAGWLDYEADWILPGEKRTFGIYDDDGDILKYTAYYYLYFTFDVGLVSNYSILEYHYYLDTSTDMSLADKLTVPNPTKAGYVFLYWQAKEDSSVKLRYNDDISALTRGYTMEAV